MRQSLLADSLNRRSRFGPPGICRRAPPFWRHVHRRFDLQRRHHHRRGFAFNLHGRQWVSYRLRRRHVESIRPARNGICVSGLTSVGDELFGGLVQRNEYMLSRPVNEMLFDVQLRLPYTNVHRKYCCFGGFCWRRGDDLREGSDRTLRFAGRPATSRTADSPTLCPRWQSASGPSHSGSRSCTAR